MSQEKKAVVFNRAQAVRLTPTPDVAMISIERPEAGYDDVVPSQGWKDFLPLIFHDIVDPPADYPGMVLFNYDMGRQIVDFLKKNDGHLYVHCDAGASRSVAVGRFAKDFFNYDLHILEGVPETFGNIRVYNILRRIMLGLEEE